MKRSIALVFVALIAACAVVGAAASLGVNSKKVDSFGGDKAAVAPMTGSSCTTATPVSMAATASGFYVTTTNNRLYQYTLNASNGFTAVGDTPLFGTNSNSSGVGVGTSAVYVLDGAERKIYRYNTDRTHSATSPRTLLPTIQPRGLAVDEANNELWTVTRDTTPARTTLRCYLLNQVFTGTGDLTQTREIILPTFSPATTDPQGLAIDGTNVYLVDGSNKRVSRTARTTGTSALGDALVGDTPTGAELRGGFLYVAGDKKRIGRFDVGLFFDGTAGNVNPSPAPVDLSHNSATGL